MTQLDFPPFSDHGTSLQAAASVHGSNAAKSRARVLEYIRSRGHYGATADEIAVALEMDLHTVTPRKWELAGLNRKSQQPAQIELSGERRKTRSGRSADVWVAITPGDRVVRGRGSND